MKQYVFDVEACPDHPDANLTVDLDWFGDIPVWGFHALCNECGEVTAGVELTLASLGKPITPPQPSTYTLEGSREVSQ